MFHFYDTEFQDHGNYQIELISIGIVNENGDTFYAINEEFNPDYASRWVKENVLSKLEPNEPCTYCSKSVWMTKKEIRDGILDFVGEETPIWVADHSAYDFMMLMGLFGTFEDKPKTWPKYSHDIRIIEDLLGDPDSYPPKDSKTRHNALVDAVWDKARWEYLKQYAEERGIRLNVFYK